MNVEELYGQFMEANKGNSMVDEEEISFFTKGLPYEDIVDFHLMLLDYAEKYIGITSVVALQNKKNLHPLLQEREILRKLAEFELFHYSDDTSSEVSRLLDMMSGKSEWNMQDWQKRRNNIEKYLKEIFDNKYELDRDAYSRYMEETIQLYNEEHDDENYHPLYRSSQ